MEKRIVNIAICLDQNLTIPAIVLLTSIKEHAPTDRLTRVFVITSFDLDKISFPLPELVPSHFEVIPIKVNNRFSALQSNSYITQGTYIRFLIPELLQNVSRILYLDVDTIVNRDPTILFDQPLHGQCLGACADIAMLIGSPRWKDYKIRHNGQDYDFDQYITVVLEMSITRNDDYFNAGVLLMDLDKWRSQGIAERTVEYLKKHPTLKFMDQDGLNRIIDGNYARLDTRWNAFASCSSGPDYSVPTLFSPSARRWEQARALWRTDPWIVHYAGPVKPWCDQNFTLPHSDMWWDYAMRSPSRDALMSAHDQFLVRRKQKTRTNFFHRIKS